MWGRSHQEAPSGRQLGKPQVKNMDKRGRPGGRGLPSRLHVSCVHWWRLLCVCPKPRPGLGRGDDMHTKASSVMRDVKFPVSSVAMCVWCMLCGQPESLDWKRFGSRKGSFVAFLRHCRLTLMQFVAAVAVVGWGVKKIYQMLKAPEVSRFGSGYIYIFEIFFLVQ